MNLVPDPVIVLLQAIPFLGVFLVLKYALLDPLLEYLLERERRMGAVGSEGGDLMAEANAAQARYEARVKEQKHDAAQLRQGLLATAHGEEQQILAEARQAAAQEAEVFRSRVAQEVEQARADLNARALTLGGDIASTVLGRQVTAQQAQ